MLKDIELPVLNDALSLSSHDFAYNLHRNEVFITLSKYSSGEPTVESSLLTRVKSFYRSLGAELKPTRAYNDFFDKKYSVAMVEKPLPAPGVVR